MVGSKEVEDRAHSRDQYRRNVLEVIGLHKIVVTYE